MDWDRGNEKRLEMPFESILSTQSSSTSFTPTLDIKITEKAAT